MPTTIEHQGITYQLPGCPTCRSSARRCKRPSGHDAASWHTSRMELFDQLNHALLDAQRRNPMLTAFRDYMVVENLPLTAHLCRSYAAALADPHQAQPGLRHSIRQGLDRTPIQLHRSCNDHACRVLLKLAATIDDLTAADTPRITATH